MDSHGLFEDYSDDCIEEEVLMTSDSSSDSSFTDEDEELLQQHVTQFLQVISGYSEKNFKSHFRLKRSTVQFLIELFESEVTNDNFGRPSLPANVQIYMYLWYMGNTVTFRQLSNLFGTAKSTAWRVINRVAAFFIKISPQFIKWPSSTQEFYLAKRGFEEIKNIPGVIAAIDGTHIKVKAPRENPQDYFNRKKYYSIGMQVIVDSKKRFLDVYCGEPGSLHDARIFRRSDIFRHLSEAPETYFPSGTFMLGDSAYPCKKWLVPPYKDNGALTDTQKKFNLLHSSTRVVVENAIGLLKTSFRRLLHFSEQTNLQLIVNLTYSACVLHNIRLLKEDDSAISNEMNPAIETYSFASNYEDNLIDRREALIQELLSRNIL